jgi:hypothetical protein
MNKVFFLIVAVLAFGSFAMANNVEIVDTTTSRPDGVVIEEIKKIEEEALYCSVTWPSGITYSCWFCSCSSLPQPPLYDAILENGVLAYATDVVKF